MYLVSACLAGRRCRYDGKDSRVEWVADLVSLGEAMAVCPEVLGGLPTPRAPSERVGSRVVSAEGADVTAAFARGAYEALRVCQEHRCTVAILKARSPSCGCGHIYDGTFSGVLAKGNGVFADLLLGQGIPVRTEEDGPERAHLAPT